MAKKEHVVAVPAPAPFPGRFVHLPDPHVNVFPLPSNRPLQLGIATGVYTAAGSQALFDTDDSSWCGAGCGTCYQLTSTGSAPCSSCGTGGDAGDSIIVMITNLCPNDSNAQWCPAVGGENDYGYSYHFDINAESEVFGDNPVVNFESVTCPSAAISDYSQCVCA